ncbi:hypothetical protein ACIP3A_10100 [Streptomyces tricolor]|uniref:hypothetical protein n=1 Tax=Streptomyces tricolor TaxID=68277 RepID=UPI00381BB9AF
MRPCTSLSPRRTAAGVAAVAAAVVAVAAPVSPDTAFADTTPPACAAADARTFPLATRIRGGPGSYEAGGGYGTWYIDLTNTTDRTCAGIHPVVVLVDDKRALRPDQPQLDFYDGSRPRPVTFESTDEQELVGVLDGAGFGGFTVPPGRTVSVRVRLALPSDAVSDQVTANAAVVQRRGRDGDWVGESNAYRFGIGQEGEQETEDTEEAEDTENAQEAQDTQDAQEAAQEGEGAQEAEALPTAPSGTASATAASGSDDPDPDSSLPLAQDAQDAQEAREGPEGREAPAGAGPHELARTGPGPAHGLLAAVTALFGIGAGTFLLLRNHNHSRSRR